MPNTYTLIASNTVGSGGVASVTFSSIPATYTDLLVKFSIRTSNSNVGQGLKVTYNGASAYVNRFLEGTGAAVSSGNGTDEFIGDIPGNTATASTFGNGELYMPNYTSSVAKSISIDAVTENNATTAYQTLTAQSYAITSAITSMSFASMGSGSPTLMQYTSFYLYGIKNS